MFVAQVPKKYAKEIRGRLSAHPLAAEALSTPLLALLIKFHNSGLGKDPVTLGPSAFNIAFRQQLKKAGLHKHLPVLLTALTKDVDAAPLPAATPAAPGSQSFKGYPAPDRDLRLPTALLPYAYNSFKRGALFLYLTGAASSLLAASSPLFNPLLTWEPPLFAWACAAWISCQLMLWDPAR
jgi:hypothetical protein